MEDPKISVAYRGQVWVMKPLTVAGTMLTLQVYDHVLEMPASCLDFSLWDATCEQIPDMVLTAGQIETLRPWLKQRECPWRIGWQRKKPAPKKPKPEDPRQGKLF